MAESIECLDMKFSEQYVLDHQTCYDEIWFVLSQQALEITEYDKRG